MLERSRLQFWTHEVGDVLPYQFSIYSINVISTQSLAFSILQIKTQPQPFFAL